MGGGTSSQYLEFEPNPKIPGQGPEIFQTFEVLCIPQGDINKYWTAFNHLNSDGTGVVTLKRFHEYYCLEPTPFSEKVFSIMDVNQTGKMNFNGFVITIWNYLSSDMLVLASFAFCIFDLDDSKTLDVAEIRNMAVMVYGNKTDRVDNVLEKLMAECDEFGVVGKKAFVEFTKKYPLSLFPAFAMQQTLRRNIIGVTHWDEATEARNKNFSGKTIFDIINIAAKQPPPKPAEVAKPVEVEAPKPKPAPAPVVEAAAPQEAPLPEPEVEEEVVIEVPVPKIRDSTVKLVSLR